MHKKKGVIKTFTQTIPEESDERGGGKSDGAKEVGLSEWDVGQPNDEQAKTGH